MRWRSIQYIHAMKVCETCCPLWTSLSIKSHWFVSMYILWFNSQLMRPSDSFICISQLNIIGSDNGLLPGQHQTMILTSTGILLFWPLATNFSKLLFKIHRFSFKKMLLKMSSVKCHSFCHGLNVENYGSVCIVLQFVCITSPVIRQ